MKEVNDNLSSPLRYILDDGRIIGQFYSSYDKQYHLAQYEPHEGVGAIFCGASTPFSGPVVSREDRPDRRKCPKCFSILERMAST